MVFIVCIEQSKLTHRQALKLQVVQKKNAASARPHDAGQRVFYLFSLHIKRVRGHIERILCRWYLTAFRHQ